MSSSINNQQHKQNSSGKELTHFQWIIYSLHFILAILFSFEIIFLLVGYIGLFQLKIKTGFWFIYEMFWLIIVSIIPFILIITIPTAGYVIFKYFKNKLNRRLFFVVLVATAMNLLSLLMIFAINRTAAEEYKKQWQKIHVEQKEWIGKTLPHFTFAAVKDGLSPFTEKDLQNKLSVLIFLHASHDPTKSPNYKIACDLYKAKEDINAQVFIIATNTSKELLKQFIEQYNIQLPLYFDPINNTKDNLGVLNSSEAVLIVNTNKILKDIIYRPNSLSEVILRLDKAR